MNEGRCIAFFDLDHTIVDCDSFRLFLRYLYSRDWKGRLAIPVLLIWVVARKLRLISLRTAKEKALSILRGRAVEEIRAIGRKSFRTLLVKRLRNAAKERIQWHRGQGHRIIIITGSPDIYVENVRETLEAESYILSRLVSPSESSAQVRWTERRDPQPEGDWYYVRVAQHNGHMAWSSPIWVG